MNRTESSVVFFGVCACMCVLHGDLLFTSPTNQPPASVAVMINERYFGGERLFPFLASPFSLLSFAFLLFLFNFNVVDEV